MANLLAGLRILVLEDEYLIAMDVEQLCRDHGAADVHIRRNLDEVENGELSFDAAIIDVMLHGRPTLDFARTLQARNVPFVFASGYADVDEIFAAFPGVAVVGKPYSGGDLVDALVAAQRKTSLQDG